MQLRILRALYDGRLEYPRAIFERKRTDCRSAQRADVAISGNYNRIAGKANA